MLIGANVFVPLTKDFVPDLPVEFERMVLAGIHVAVCALLGVAVYRMLGAAYRRLLLWL
jgi:hypothetical protein